ncbi:E3 ubiquitin-protein ligase MSL2 [Sitophilus oryzae]|uniref:E3 ubiquitin-protein ligase MSL2 n=1 Tax=Sitophilus oryzae TaxID=7048 RepID=A0A6J2XZ89_SITOR|nr:E3 ubiquitin-protein ligase MSL2 [Sitophilus oryzae]
MSSTSIEKSSTQTRMNSTNLYVTTTQIILKSDPANPQSWQDLYRLVPYLRNSLCCVVCSMLLVEPLTPSKAQCQHHLCRRCKGGRKKIKPQCESCKDCTEYTENKSLRILMQMYKKMCVNLINSRIFKCITIQSSQPGTGFERGASNLIQLIKEGAMFQDDYESKGGIPKSTYSILPCIYTNTVCPQNISVPPQQPRVELSNNQNRNSLYSVVYPGSGNKITIKRKSKDSTNSPNNINNVNASKPKEYIEKVVFKKPCSKPKKGCRCGNATATPGKLTCCGQRCPCYVESKACIDCKCRGCRNPHRPDGNKVMPYIPELESPQKIMPSIQDIQLRQFQILQSTIAPIQPPPSVLEDESMTAGVKLETLQLDTQFFTSESLNNPFKSYKFLGSSFDSLASLSGAELLAYGMPEEEEESDITVV